MKFTQEFEFTCREITDGDTQTFIKRFSSDDGYTFDKVVEEFLGFLSAAYGYEITLGLLGRMDESSSY